MTKYRLSRSIVPETYDLSIFPDFNNGTFTGKVVMDLNVKSTTDLLQLHSKDLKIIRAKLNEQDVKFELDENLETLSIEKRNVYQAGSKLVLTIEYEGDMKNKLVGMYRSSYKEKDRTRTIATTKFEPTYARQAFPCFDEPNMKAKYTVHIWRPNDPDYIALSNYPQESEDEYNNGKLVHFRETVSMPTYLSCFIVCDFKYTETYFENKNNSNVTFRVYATPEQLHKTEYAGKVGKAAIEFYIDYFNIPYPLPKLDMVAIPDYSSGATEHWGLVTFRETALLYDSDAHSTENQQRVLLVVAHELAHSWFGNLVTMDWWDNLWLNEGFASYIEYKGGNAAEPNFGLMEQFLVRELHPVLALDAKLSSHPIIQEVTTPDQITEVFDTISYNKGASILRMLERIVGEANFRAGITNYLNKYKYGNAVTKQLWTEIQAVLNAAVSGAVINVSEFMDTFTLQMGYPILNVSEDNGTTFRLTQTRFLSNPEDAHNQKPSPLHYKWTVPVTYVTDQGASKEITWFHKDNDSVLIEKPKDAKWFKFNNEQVGYYRVNYPESYWTKLSAFMLELSISDRTHMLEEAFSIANAGQLNYEIPLGITKYLVDEDNFTPWYVASSQLMSVLNILDGTEYEQQFKDYVIGLLSPVYKNVTWAIPKDDSHLKKLLRVVVIKLACKMGMEDALKQASNQLDSWFTLRVATPDLRDIIYEHGMKSASQEKWEQMFKIFEVETDANEKLKQLHGLTAVSDRKLLLRLLELSKNETYIRKQDYYQFIAFMSSNPVGLPLVWDYYRENWESLVERFTLNDRNFGNLIVQITATFSTKTKLSEMERFFEIYPHAGAGTAARKRAVENVRNRIYRVLKYKNVIGNWLVENKFE